MSVEVRIPIDEFVTGDLPLVDPLDGQSAHSYLELTARPRTGPGLLLLFFGVVPYLVWAMMRAEPVNGVFRVSDDTVRLYQAQDRRNAKRTIVAAGALVLGAVAAFVGVFFIGAPEVIVPGVVVAVVAVVVLVFVANTSSPVRLYLERGSKGVVVFVHPDFRHALVARSASTGSRSGYPVDELERLAVLRREGTLSPDEFVEAKRQLLGHDAGIGATE